MPDLNDATPNLTMASTTVMEELIHRLETELPERDLVAIATALSKGVVRGFKLGAAFVDDGLRRQAEQRGLNLDFAVVIEESEPGEVDLWAEQYGGSSPSD